MIGKIHKGKRYFFSNEQNLTHDHRSRNTDSAD
jgi:YHS domain-containing protein